jgi:glycosyltransferase involved in cell wall biosynthesis
MKIAFYQPHICLYGTTVSYYDYAHFNQSILGNKSYMIYDRSHPANNELVIDKFKRSMEVIPLDGHCNMGLVEKKLDELNVDALYIQKCGKKDDGIFVKNKPVFIHAVGCENDPHGLVYAYVSEWLSKELSNYERPFIPYMAHLPEHEEDFRADLNIPLDATVFSRMGGFYSWNIPFVNSVIATVLNEREDVYFVFAQTEKFIDHPRVIHVDPFADLITKRKFINTSDVFLHARAEGESFGMACAEYSICNKPIITYEHSPERSHIFTLGDKGIYYDGPEKLLEILRTFKYDPSSNYNAYDNLSPQKVIEKFKNVFLDKL